MFRQECLANNIKAFRKLRRLTQGALAQRLFVTAQNVSKWETGKSVPDLENLCKLAEVFSVTPDQLLGSGEVSERQQLLAAIDGGGTKTEFVLFTPQGQIVKRLVLKSSNPNVVGMEQAQQCLQSGMEQLLAESSDIRAVFAGIAGCGLKANQTQMQAFMKKTYPMIRSFVESDVMNVIHASPTAERCIAVICGTGSVVFAKTPDRLQRLGGWGYLWESGCSGYDFGRDALHAVLAVRDAVGPPTLLQELVETRLGGDIREHINDLYRLGQDGIAAFAPEVFRAYARQDAVAAQILEKNAGILAKLINAAAERYDCGHDVVIAGGLVSQKQVLTEFLREKLKPDLRLQFMEKPQICGAAAGCCRNLGELDPEFQEVFYKNYIKITEDLYAENRNA